MNGWCWELRMRYVWRYLVSLQAVIYLFLVFGTALGVQGQSVNARAADGVASQSSAQPQSDEAKNFPAWIEGVKELAGKIEEMARPKRTVSLEIKNISSLPLNIKVIRDAVAGVLLTHGMKLGRNGARVDVTVSENFQGLVWVAEIYPDEKSATAKVAIVLVPRVIAETAGEKRVSLALSRELVWQQAREMLDFAVFYRPTDVAGSTLVILEADKLVYYGTTTVDWRLWRTVKLPRSEPRRRDPAGELWVAGDGIYANGVQCSGEIEHPSKIECAHWDDVTIGRRWIGPAIPGHEGNAGGVLGDRCGSKSVALASGDGDWAQRDAIQGYLLSDNDMVPSGSPIEFDGPVIAVRGGDKSSVRAIVHNLKTGNYEGYIVTATCSQ